MKLAIVIGSLGRGGSERQIVELVRVAHPGQAQMLVICIGDEGPLAGDVRAAGAVVIALRARRLFGPRAVWWLARTLRCERPDAIYAFLFWGYCVSLPLARVVLPRAGRIQARRSLPEVDVPRWSIFGGLRRLADRCSDGVIANSLAVGRAAAGHEPVLSGRIWVVPNGVRPAPARVHAEEGPVTVVCVANLVAYKGHAVLLEAVRRLPAHGWSLLLVGEGPERDVIEETIAAMNLGERVRMLGQRSDIGEILETADLLALPSYTEGMPNAVLEAMAHGLPVVASDVGGVRSLLGSGAGIVVTPGDEAGLADALQSLIESPSRRAEMGARGRALVRDRLTIETMAGETVDAITAICAQRRHGL